MFFENWRVFSLLIKKNLVQHFFDGFDYYLVNLVGFLKAGVNLNGIFEPLNTGLMQISRSRFKQSKNSMLKT